MPRRWKQIFGWGAHTQTKWIRSKLKDTIRWREAFINYWSLFSIIVVEYVCVCACSCASKGESNEKSCCRFCVSVHLLLIDYRGCHCWPSFCADASRYSRFGLANRTRTLHPANIRLRLHTNQNCDKLESFHFMFLLCFFLACFICTEPLLFARQFRLETNWMPWMHQFIAVHFYRLVTGIKKMLDHSLGACIASYGNYRK